MLIGSRAASLRDNFHTPFTRFGQQANLAVIDGVELHAHRLGALFDLQAGGRFQMVALPAWLNLGLLSIALALGILVGERTKSFVRSALLLLLLYLDWFPLLDYLMLLRLLLVLSYLHCYLLLVHNHQHRLFLYLLRLLLHLPMHSVLLPH